QHVRVRSDQFNSLADPSTIMLLDVPAGESKLWRREEASSNPFKQPVVTKLYAKNLGNAPANVRLTVIRRIANPEMLLVPIMAIIFGVLLLVTVAYKPIYDYREGGYEINHQAMNNDPTWHDCHREMVQTVPGIVLAYLETLVIAALSVAISTRLPAIANFLISFAIYVLGHLTPLLVQSQVVAQQLPPVVFFGRLIATVLPVLDHF